MTEFQTVMAEAESTSSSPSSLEYSTWSWGKSALGAALQQEGRREEIACEKGYGRMTRKQMGVMKACGMMKVVTRRLVGEVEAGIQSRK